MPIPMLSVAESRAESQSVIIKTIIKSTCYRLCFPSLTQSFRISPRGHLWAECLLLCIIYTLCLCLGIEWFPLILPLTMLKVEGGILVQRKCIGRRFYHFIFSKTFCTFTSVTHGTSLNSFWHLTENHFTISRPRNAMLGKFTFYTN